MIWFKTRCAARAGTANDAQHRSFPQHDALELSHVIHIDFVPVDALDPIFIRSLSKSAVTVKLDRMNPL